MIFIIQGTLIIGLLFIVIGLMMKRKIFYRVGIYYTIPAFVYSTVQLFKGDFTVMLFITLIIYLTIFLNKINQSLSFVTHFSK